MLVIVISFVLLSSFLELLGILILGENNELSCSIYYFKPVDLSEADEPPAKLVILPKLPVCKLLL